jgi:release factor glutamine methyltransferase
VSRPRQVTPSILDLGTGSGCIAITLALELPLSRVTAVDSSGAALQVAAGNAQALGASLRLLQGDWLSGLAGECFDLIVSNPPYVAAADAHLAQGDLRHEPRQALVGGADGLDAIRDIVAAASSHLAPGGSLMIEHGSRPGRRSARADGRCRVRRHQGACGSCGYLARNRRWFALGRRSARG